MSLWTLLLQHAGPRRWWIAGAVCAAGFLRSLVVVVVNHVTAAGAGGGGSWIGGLLFLAIVAALWQSSRLSARWASDVFESFLHDLRSRLADGMRRASLRSLERHAALEGRILGDLTLIETSSMAWLSLLQLGAFVVFVTPFIAWTSLRGLWVWLVALGAVAWILLPRIHRLDGENRELSRHRGSMNAQVETLLDAFKQLKLDRPAARHIAAELEQRIERFTHAQRMTMESGDIIALTGLLISVAVARGTVVFAPVATIGVGPAVGYELAAIFTLTAGPIFGLLSAIPVRSKAWAATASVLDALEQLDAETHAPASGDAPGFARLECVDLRFAYEREADGAAPFTVGPVDLTIERGSLVLITGGNGSGKTTLMKMLLGLYPCRGRLVWDGTPVTGSRMADYRGLFTAIFGQQHLFPRLYGLEDRVDRARVEALLADFGIDAVTGYVDGRFTHLDLSSGQRMRLAMVVALLEDRPICVFDEWTANQDPEMTRHYYDALLPRLIAEGRTVIAVSHDDRFFDRADHLIRLDRGQVIVDRQGHD